MSIGQGSTRFSGLSVGGTARPIKGQLFWKTGDEWMGDPSMEERG